MDVDPYIEKQRQRRRQEQLRSIGFVPAPPGSGSDHWDSRFTSAIAVCENEVAQRQRQREFERYLREQRLGGR